MAIAEFILWTGAVIFAFWGKHELTLLFFGLMIITLFL